MSASSRPEILQPFAEADGFIETLFLLWEDRVPLKRDSEYDFQMDNLDYVIDRTQLALAEFHGAVRASDMTDSEFVSFLKRGEQDNLGRNTQEYATYTNFLIYQIAFGKLLQMVWANYAQLHPAQGYWHDRFIYHAKSDWYKNRTPEHIYRELEQMVKILKRISKNPPKAINHAFYDVLRAGHTMAAISQIEEFELGQ